MCIRDRDHNGLQIDGPNEKVMGLGSIPDKLHAFGLTALQIDGHSFLSMEGAFEIARQTKGSPCAIVLETTKGKGVSYMEGQVGWHGVSAETVLLFFGEQKMSKNGG